MKLLNFSKISMLGFLIWTSFFNIYCSEAKKNKASMTVKNQGTESLSDIGVQLYTLRSLTKKDLEAVFKDLSEMGYTQVELAGLEGKSEAEFKALLDKYNLKAVASHIPFDVLKKDPESLIRQTKALGIKYMVLAWFPPFERRHIQQYYDLAKMLNDVGAKAKKEGIQFVYHNHDFEFKKLNGEIPYDVILKNTDSELVKLELDLFWIEKAEANALEYFKAYPGRFVFCHVKDMDSKGNMVDVGKGQIDFAQLFKEGKKAGLEYFVVEHDNPDHPIQSVKNSIEYLKSFKF